jgi:hypothetical protein
VQVGVSVTELREYGEEYLVDMDPVASIHWC